MKLALVAILAFVLTGSTNGDNLRQSNAKKARALQASNDTEACNDLVETLVELPMNSYLDQLNTMFQQATSEGNRVVNRFEGLAANNTHISNFGAQFGGILAQLQAAASQMGGVGSGVAEAAQSEVDEMVNLLDASGAVDYVSTVEAQVEHSLVCLTSMFCKEGNAFLSSLPYVSVLGGSITMALGSCVNEASEGNFDEDCFKDALKQSIAAAASTANVFFANTNDEFKDEMLSFTKCNSAVTHGGEKRRTSTFSK